MKKWRWTCEMQPSNVEVVQATDWSLLKLMVRVVVTTTATMTMTLRRFFNDVSLISRCIQYIYIYLHMPMFLAKTRCSPQYLLYKWLICSHGPGLMQQHKSCLDCIQSCSGLRHLKPVMLGLMFFLCTKPSKFQIFHNISIAKMFE